MFKRVLIANRGEIALRAIHACKELGIETVAVYTEADSQSLHVKYADHAVCIGKGKAAESYLYSYNVFAVAEKFEVDAIYPGTGFFSENSIFASLCEKYGFTFVGTTSDTLDLLTDKLSAKACAVNVGMPIARASDSVITSVAECTKIAKDIGFPVLIKASEGGGGKGIRIVNSENEIESAFTSCSEEARNYFKSDKLFVEKFIADARHVEVQILADQHGNVIHLLDRDCTMQRRNQKLIEEGVSIFVDKSVKKHMYEDAVKLIKHIGYFGAATVEFLVDKDMNYYFMEVNPRVQVEHPVTEQITGVDIVKQQLLIAAGEKMTVKESIKTPKGHAIECRINAEDVSSNFMCSTGKIKECCFPRGGGIRVESHICEGFTVTPFYDSMLAKIITYADTREAAIKKMLIALDETYIEGVKTNIELQKTLLTTDEFNSGKFNTHFATDFIEKNYGK